jgi:hypothetical protein
MLVVQIFKINCLTNDKKLMFASALWMLLFACTKVDNKQDTGLDVRGSIPKVPFKVSVADFVQRVEELAVPTGRTISPARNLTCKTIVA